MSIMPRTPSIVHLVCAAFGSVVLVCAKSMAVSPERQQSPASARENSPHRRRALEQCNAVCLIKGPAILTYIRRCANQRCRFVASLIATASTAHTNRSVTAVRKRLDRVQDDKSWRYTKYYCRISTW